MPRSNHKCPNCVTIYLRIYNGYNACYNCGYHECQQCDGRMLQDESITTKFVLVCQICGYSPDGEFII